MKNDWKWFGNAGHLIVAQWCRFHLCTQVGDHLVSTVGEYWPERPTREIHAQVHDPRWLTSNRHLKGDAFDAAYMKRFDFEEIGCGRKYETMVFATGGVCAAEGCNCGMPIPASWSEIDSDAYNDAGSATRGHIAMCEKFDDSVRQLDPSASDAKAHEATNAVESTI